MHRCAACRGLLWWRYGFVVLSDRTLYWHPGGCQTRLRNRLRMLFLKVVK